MLVGDDIFYLVCAMDHSAEQQDKHSSKCVKGVCCGRLVLQRPVSALPDDNENGTEAEPWVSRDRGVLVARLDASSARGGESRG